MLGLTGVNTIAPPPPGRPIMAGESIWSARRSAWEVHAIVAEERDPAVPSGEAAVVRPVGLQLWQAVRCAHVSEVVTLTVMPFDRRSSQPITDADAVAWRRSRVEVNNADDSHVLSGHKLLRSSRKMPEFLFRKRRKSGCLH